MSQGGTEMKKAMISAIMLAAMAATGSIAQDHKDKDSKRFQFDPNSLVLSRSVYTGTAAIVAVGQVLPPGCVPVTIPVPLIARGSANVNVKCANAVDNGEYPNLQDNHNVWNNDG